LFLSSTPFILSFTDVSIPIYINKLENKAVTSLKEKAKIITSVPKSGEKIFLESWKNSYIFFL
jgi:hypothetical protein